MEPELDNGSIVELVYLATHGDEAVAVLNLLNILLSGCLCGYLTQHCLGGAGGCKHHVEQEKEPREGGRDKRMEKSVMEWKDRGGGVGEI